MPIPDTVRDAVLIGFAELDEAAGARPSRRGGGRGFDLEVMAGLAGAAGSPRCSSRACSASMAGAARSGTR